MKKDSKKELSHKERLVLTDRLLSDLDIRKGLRGKLFYLYPKTFQLFHSLLLEAEDFDWLIGMHTTSSTLSNKSGSVIIIHPNKELSYNAQLILQDIFDDYWAFCLCFQNGFTKQAQAILRGTLELIVQLFYLKYLSNSGEFSSDSWALGSRGIGKLRDKITLIKNANVLNFKTLASDVDDLYNRLSTSTHSRKDRLASWNLPRLARAKDMPSFEPIEIFYTKGLFCAVLDLELRMIKRYLEDETETIWIEQLCNIPTKMLEILDRMEREISYFKKGYIIHREYILLSNNKQILYSVNLDKKFVFPGRNKPKLTQAEVKEFLDKIEERLVEDII